MTASPDYLDDEIRARVRRNVAAAVAKKARRDARRAELDRARAAGLRRRKAEKLARAQGAGTEGRNEP